MTVPDMRHVPQKLFDTGLFDLRTHEGQGAFVDAVVSLLHALDARWGHLKKKPGQTDVHGHGEDAALFLSDEAGTIASGRFRGRGRRAESAAVVARGCAALQQD